MVKTMSELIRVENLTKSYHGLIALNNISLSIESGKIIGLLGPNGSGKSNIIDSVLFALGLASARNLRTEQLSDFIACT